MSFSSLCQIQRKCLLLFVTKLNESRRTLLFIHLFTYRLQKIFFTFLKNEKMISLQIDHFSGIVRKTEDIQGPVEADPEYQVRTFKISISVQKFRTTL
jgi:hypothetical protein